MAPDNLEKLFQKLNPAQRSAVETVEGPVMVVAGPGTGKTQILTLRVANILLKTDAGAENILALTFTEAAAANMRRRLVSLIGTSGYYVNIHTFHGFCNKLIREYPEYFPRIIGGAAATLSDQIGLVRKIIDTTKLKHLKPFGNKYYYAAEILKSIRQLKNEGFDTDKFKKISDSPKNRELALIYQKYQRELDRKKRYDFEDMILETINALKHNRDFLLDLREKYQYILVDEHQDTNGAQNKTLELLAGDDRNPNLFVVGDEKQAIFRFQGASIENFLYFKTKFSQAKLINLKENYRSHQHILDAGHSLIEKNKAVLALTKLQAQPRRTALPGRAVLPEKIKIGSFDRPETEYLFIAEKIKELIKQKTPLGEIAVLYRENKDAPAIADFLARSRVPHAVESDENALDDVEIKKLNTLLGAIENFGDDEHLVKALHLDFLGVDPMALYKLPNQDISRLNINIIKKLGIWKKLSYNTTFPKFFETVINESGFLKNLLSRPDYRGKLEKLNALFSEIKNSALSDPDYNLSDYLNYLAVLKEHNLPLNSKTARTHGAIRLMTAHRAKGLEFDYVFITGAYNGHWGNKRNRNYFDLPVKTGWDASKLEKNEDERRLFYMALTRTRKNVFITYSALSPEGREQVPSQFIGEIKPELKEEIASSPYEAKLARCGSVLSMPIRPAAVADEKNAVKEMFLKRGLSPTSLNNYLACPWRFFYVNLLRIPKTQNRHQIYGTAKHNALQKFFDAKKENKKIGGKFLVDSFAAELKGFTVTPADRAILLQRGRETLAAYYNFYKDSWNHNTINEVKISGVDFPLGRSETIQLTGKLDKIELHKSTIPKPGLGRNSNIVVDYKTKAPESRNWILGKTKNSNGDYFRQLVFYKLLTDSLPKKKFEMESGVIDFVEPDDKGRFRKERFEISAADVKELKETIARAADEIINLKFWASRCGQKDCEFCELREMLPSSQYETSLS